MAERIVFRGNYAGFRAVLVEAAGILSGRLADPTGLLEPILIRVGLVVLSLVSEAFVVKARGGTDACGIRWKPLDPRTIAYGRKHPGLTRKPGVRRPTLTPAQDRRWRSEYARRLRWYAKEGDPRGHAAAVAWVILKGMGAQTVLELYGDTPVEILRDTGALLNSLSPVLSDGSRVLRPGRGRVAVGSALKYARRQHRARPIFPPGDRWPKEWKEEVGDELRRGAGEVVKALCRLRGAA